MQTLVDQVKDAYLARRMLQIRGGGSKDWYGNAAQGSVIDVSGHSGIVEYAPAELVLTAKAGTRLAEIETVLAANNQMLSFEPPHYGDSATLGGTLACGFSGARRPYSGSARDAVLGVQILDGRGDLLNFGGKVIKNVAGYDISRLTVGALGTLGIILQASVKVVPRPAATVTLQYELDQAASIVRMNELAGQPLPLTAAAWINGVLSLRLEGNAAAVLAAQAKLGGDILDHAADFWLAAREHTAPFFADETPLWRLSVPPTVPPLDLPGKQAVTWGGAQRWLKSATPAASIYAAAARIGGHAALYRGARPQTGVFHALPAAVMALHRRLKTQFDPHGILNRGRLYSDF